MLVHHCEIELSWLHSFPLAPQAAPQTPRRSEMRLFNYLFWASELYKKKPTITWAWEFQKVLFVSFQLFTCLCFEGPCQHFWSGVGRESWRSPFRHCIFESIIYSKAYSLADKFWVTSLMGATALCLVLILMEIIQNEYPLFWGAVYSFSDDPLHGFVVKYQIRQAILSLALISFLLNVFLSAYNR